MQHNGPVSRAGVKAWFPFVDGHVETVLGMVISAHVLSSRISPNWGEISYLLESMSCQKPSQPPADDSHFCCVYAGISHFVFRRCQCPARCWRWFWFQVGVGGKVRGGQRWGVFRKMLVGKQNERKMYHVDVCLRQAATDASTIQD